MVRAAIDHEQHVEEDGQVVERVGAAEGRAGVAGLDQDRRPPRRPGRRGPWLRTGVAPARGGHVDEQDRRRDQDGDDDRRDRAQVGPAHRALLSSADRTRLPPGRPGRGARRKSSARLGKSPSTTIRTPSGTSVGQLGPGHVGQVVAQARRKSESAPKRDPLEHPQQVRRRQDHDDDRGDARCPAQRRTSRRRPGTRRRSRTGPAARPRPG